MTNSIPYNVLRNRPMVAGAVHTKDAPLDEKTRAETLDRLGKELGDALPALKKAQDEFKQHAIQLKELGEKVAKLGDDGETKAALKKHGEDLAAAVAKMQAFEQGIEQVKREMDQPFFKGGKELMEKDRDAAVELQRRVFLAKGLGDPTDFRPDLDNLVNPVDYRAAVHKLLQVGLDSKRRVVAGLSENERKAFDAASLDSGFFSPELLGIEVDCEIECASLLDLYDSASVSKSTFMFPHVQSYGDIGKYDCDAKCDAEYGPEGNITWKNGSTYDFRGVFCFQRDTLREANYDLLGFMMRAAARSYRINRNRALITGDGVNEPLGWLTADCFTKVAAPAQNPTHQDLRQFLASAPVEYGAVQAVMHQNTFAYFASMVDSTGRFIFGDGLMGFSPSDVVDRIRISNCLPDPTEGGTKGSAASPFDAGAFIMAAGNWPRAFTAVNHRPMFMEQYEGGSSAWCVKYQFGAKDGGFVTCCPAARTFQAGAGA